jgi:hypothetical protein
LDRAFGLLLLVVYVGVVVGLSAGVTFLVIKLFPVKSKTSTPDEPSNDGDGGPAGRLFRRAKRAAT